MELIFKSWYLPRKYELENYLSYISNITDRVNLTKLRISAHQLRIEKGRYEIVNKKPLLECERICKYCNTGEVENEVHFVMSCPLYRTLRKKLFSELNINMTSKIVVFKHLMESQNSILSISFSKYVTECIKMRTSVSTTQL